MNQKVFAFLTNFQHLFNKRDKSIVLFGGWFGKAFSDNSRFLFQYLSDNKDKYSLSHVVWVTRSVEICELIQGMGYEAYMANSPESIHYHKVAAYHIICNQSVFNGSVQADINVEYSAGAKLINLWHGAGAIKGVNRMTLNHKKYEEEHRFLTFISRALNSFSLYRKFSSVGFWNDCYYLCVSEANAVFMRKLFLLPQTHFIISSYPRTLKCLKHTNLENVVINKLGECRVILYLPTFRDNSHPFEKPITNKLMVKWLKDNHFLWVEKGHEAANDKYDEEIIDDNILILPSNFDINVIVSLATLLISDYSSAIFDALYFNIPVFYYTPDYDYYAHSDRGIVLKPEEYIVGPVSYSVNQLIEHLDIHKNDFLKSRKNNYSTIRDSLWEGNVDSYDELWNKLKLK